MATHGLLQPAPARSISAVAPSRITSAAGSLLPKSSPPCCSGCRLEQRRSSTGMDSDASKLLDPFNRADSFVRSGRQSHQGGIYLDYCNGWRKQQSNIVTGALPTEVSAAAAALAVGGAIFALRTLNKDAGVAQPTKRECEACGGSGVCPTCSGEGFVNKKVSAEAAAKARAGAKDAATRYTAGLAKKWNYCTTCGGQRGCQSCEGRGWTA